MASQFLNSDPFLENLNRYSYVFNNPLKFVDPTGYYMEQSYFDMMKQRYDYEGGGFWYRGSYYSYNSYSGLFYDQSGNSGGGSGYYYENGGYVYNGNPVSYSEVYHNYIQPNAYFSLNGEQAASFFSGLQNGFSMYSYNLFGRTCLILSDGDPGLYGGDNIGYKAMNPTAGSYLSEIVITGQSSGGNFNIGNAVNWLNENAHSSWKDAKGQCAKYVRLALEAGGINTSNHPVAARAYGPYLEKWGFQAMSNTNYQKGDIAVIQGYHGGTADPITGIPYGHIQMFNGSIWISDFKQLIDFWPGRDYRTNKPAFVIYRWGN